MKKRVRIGNKTWEYESSDPIDVAFITRKQEWHSPAYQQEDISNSVGVVDFAGNYPVSQEAGDISHVFVDCSEDDGWDGYKVKLKRGRKVGNL
jgi:hypothetical protein